MRSNYLHKYAFINILYMPKRKLLHLTYHSLQEAIHDHQVQGHPNSHVLHVHFLYSSYPNLMSNSVSICFSNDYFPIQVYNTKREQTMTAFILLKHF